MKILHVVPTYLPATRYGGTIYAVHGLAKALAARGNDVEVFTTDVDGAGVSGVPLDRPVELDRVAVSYFPTAAGRRLYRSPAMSRVLAQRVSEFDCLHLHSVFLWPTATAAACARRHGVPYVLTPHGMLDPDLIRRRSSLVKTAWIAAFERRNLAGAAAVHATSGLERDQLAALGLRTRRTVVIPNGVDLPSPLPHRELQHHAPLIVSLGRVNWKKGLDGLIRAMSRMAEGTLVIAGNDEEGYRSTLEEIARDCGVASRVRFVGPVYGDDKWRLLASADLFVLPSHSENFGMVVLEAMAVGVPVVVTPTVGLASAVVETRCGIVVDGAPESLASAISALIAAPDKRHAMGKAGRMAARDRFSWPAIAEQVERLYADSVQPRSRMALSSEPRDAVE